MQRQVQGIVLFAMVALMVAPAAAAQPGWTVRLHGVWVQPSVDLSGVESDIPVNAGSNGALGAGGGLEYRFGRWAGLGFDALHAGPDIVLTANLTGGPVEVSDSLGFTPFSVGPVFHVTPGRAVDLTFTAVVGYARYGDLQYTAGGETLSLRGGGASIWGLGAAVDIRPGASDWAIHAGVRRYESNPEFTNRANGAVGSVEFDPVVVSFGVSYRF
jgi:hypothetical protein